MLLMWTGPGKKPCFVRSTQIIIYQRDTAVTILRLFILLLTKTAKILSLSAAMTLCCVVYALGVR